MDFLKKLFFFSFKEKKDVTALVVNVIIYVVAAAVAGIVIGLVAKIPIVGPIIGTLGGLVDLYAVIGIVLTFLDYFKVIK